MADDSISWIGLALSALLVIDKFFTKNKMKKCKCCGACFEFEGSPDASSPRNNNKEPTIEIQNKI